MFKILLLQAAAVLAMSILAGLLAGPGGALSALAGGMAYFLPNLLFVLRLRLVMASSPTRSAGAAGFLIGEAVKLSVVIVLLTWLPRMIEVHWPALIAGLFVVLIVNLFALLLKT